jgi:hypothetical protein
MSVSSVPEPLAVRLGHDASDALVALLDSTRQEWTEDVVTMAVNRFEGRLTTEISSLRVDMVRELSGLRQDVTRDLSAVRVELLKWSFLFWVGQVAAMAGLLAFMLRTP